VKNTNKNWK